MEWISVEDKKLLEKETIGRCEFSKDVLVSDGFYCFRGYYNFSNSQWYIYDVGKQELKYSDAEYWMPLPEFSEES